jgi:hypothetical protein
VRTALAIIAVLALGFALGSLCLNLSEHKTDLALSRVSCALWIVNYLLILFSPVRTRTESA